MTHKMKSEIKNISTNEIELQAIYESAPIIMFLVDSDCRVRKSNAETSKILNKSTKELLGLRGGDMLGCLHRFDDPAGCGFGVACQDCTARKTIVDTLDTGKKNYKVETPITVIENGKQVTLYLLMSTSKIDLSDEFLVLVSIENITERKLNEIELNKHRQYLEELVAEKTNDLKTVNVKLEGEIHKQKETEKIVKQSLKKEKEINESKGMFIERASHEFRTPMTSILTSTEILDLFGKKLDDNEFKEHIERITGSVEQVTSLMDNILILNRTSTNISNSKVFSTDLYSLCNSVVEEIKNISVPNHLVNLDFCLPKSHFNLDEMLCRLIIFNLMSNAVKYSPGGGKILLSIKEENNHLSMVVEDEGVGIPEKFKDQIFEPFSRCTNTREIPGTGLGLAIVKKSVELLDGNIGFKSKLNSGSKFSVHIPLK